MKNTHTFEWRSYIDVRYPLIAETQRIPLRQLAATLGVSYQSLVSAAGRLPCAPLAMEKVEGADGQRPKFTLLINADDLGSLILLARPRNATTKLKKMLILAKQLTLLHPPVATPEAHKAQARCAVLTYQLEVEKQRYEDLRRTTALDQMQASQRMNERRWAGTGLLDEIKIAEIVELAKGGMDFSKIAFKTGKSIILIRQLLTGRYSSAAAQRFYLKNGLLNFSDPASINRRSKSSGKALRAR